MIDIKEYLTRILNAVYGEEVRESIHDAIEVCHSEMLTGAEEVETARIEIAAAREEMADARTEIEASRAAVSNNKDYVVEAKAEISANTEFVAEAKDKVLSAEAAINEADVIAKAAEIVAIKQAIDDILINQNYITVKFYNEGDLLYVQLLGSEGGDVNDPVKTLKIPAPTKVHHTFIGWDRELTDITENTDINAVLTLDGLRSADLVQRTLSGDYVNDTVENIGEYAFYDCNGLTKADFYKVTSIGKSAFMDCGALETLILRNTSLCKLEDVDAFEDTPIVDGAGYIYIPKVLIPNIETSTEMLTESKTYTVGTDVLPWEIINFTAHYMGDSAYPPVGLKSICTVNYIDGTSEEIYSPSPDYHPVVISEDVVDIQITGNSEVNITHSASMGVWVAYLEKFRAIEDYPEICGGE